MSLPGLESFNRGTRRGADALNNQVQEDLEVEVMEIVRRRANRLLAGPDYVGLSEEQLTNIRTQLITAWLP